MTRTEISNLFNRHKTRDRIASALAYLLERGLARSEEEPTDGRNVERWFAV
jgi:hypothetical protein